MPICQLLLICFAYASYMKSQDIFVGTSGWQYAHWRSSFYPKDLPLAAWLHFFKHVFNTVEINSTFYRLPKAKLFDKWYKDVADRPGFKFSVKLNMLFTRFRRLKLTTADQGELREFLSNARHLKEHLGPILIQLPPGLKADAKVLADFTKILKQTGPKLQFAIEFRHASWLNESTYKLLKKQNIAFVIGHSNRWPSAVVKTADWVFVRFHGAPRLYTSNYSDEQLSEWTKKIKALRPKQAYVYFNNDAAGHAPDNAMTMAKLLGAKQQSSVQKLF